MLRYKFTPQMFDLKGQGYVNIKNTLKIDEK